MKQLFLTFSRGMAAWATLQCFKSHVILQVCKGFFRLDIFFFLILVTKNSNDKSFCTTEMLLQDLASLLKAVLVKVFILNLPEGLSLTRLQSETPGMVLSVITSEELYWKQFVWPAQQLPEVREFTYYQPQLNLIQQMGNSSCSVSLPRLWKLEKDRGSLGWLGALIWIPELSLSVLL